VNCRRHTQGVSTDEMIAAWDESAKADQREIEIAEAFQGGSRQVSEHLVDVARIFSIPKRASM
jgi:hypothetical protein